ncbi:hypothetical protein ACLKA6_000582 [Drosophila palustris]
MVAFDECCEGVAACSKDQERRTQKEQQCPRPAAFWGSSYCVSFCAISVQFVLTGRHTEKRDKNGVGEGAKKDSQATGNMLAKRQLGQQFDDNVKRDGTGSDQAQGPRDRV